MAMECYVILDLILNVFKALSDVFRIIEEILIWAMYRLQGGWSQ